MRINAKSLKEKFGNIVFVDSRFMAPSELEETWEKDGFSVTGTLNLNRKGIHRKEMKAIQGQLNRGLNPNVINPT